jgi:hypothetical protein
MIRRILAPRLARGYLLRDEFSTAQSAPLTSPRSSEPGPGILKVGQPGNEISIASSIVQASGGGAGNGVVFVVGNATLAYAAGRSLKVVGVKDASGNNSYVGWVTENSNITPASLTGMSTIESGFYRQFNKSSITLPSSLSTTAKDFSFVRNADGGMWVFENAALSWVDDGSNTSAFYPLVFSAVSAASTPSADAVRVVDLGSIWSASEGIASVNAANPSSGAGYTAVADALHEIAFTLPGSPVNGDKIELRYRVADANNYWTAYVKYNGATWDLFLDSVSSGTPTNRITVNSVGAPDKIRVSANGTKHDLWTRASGNWTKRGSQVNVSFQDTQTTINATFNAGTVTAIKSYPRSSGVYNDLGGI